MDLRWSVANYDGAGDPPAANRRRRNALMASTLIGLAVAPSAAHAEGSWQSSLSHVATKYESRRWTDRHTDANYTTATLGGCSRDDGATFSLNVELRRSRTALPDDSYGTRNVNSCTYQQPTVDWGVPTATGTFFNRYLHYDFGTISANPVKAAY
ncbi:hypothetical protein [Frankia sp. AgKG'84/4]|nr:hypothetical protein [Frankia sp. AgKG'84/4]